MSGSAAQSTLSVDRFTRAPERHIIVTPSRDRTVKRKLRGIHLFMITINATLGIGLYWRGGQILELGGPLAVLLAFLLVGLLSWAVMQCITEMLCIWPIPGAMSVYVSEFVDVELGIAVGIAYWFTYSVSFSAIIATSAAEFDFWPTAKDKGIAGGIIYFCIPLTLVLINMFRIEIYGFIEVVSGTLKLLFLVAIIISLIAVNVGVGPGTPKYLGVQYWKEPTPFDASAAKNWGTAFFMSLSIAIFAYVGVEVISASALEAQWPKQRIEEARQSNDTLIGDTVKFSAIFIPILVTIAYCLSGLLATLDIEWDDCQLPRVSWITNKCTTTLSSSSAFVAIAKQSRIPHLENLFNAFLVFTCITCANTNLYIASRTLFGLTSRLDGGSGQPWYIRILALLGKTNHRKVPMRATVVSAIAFCWVPFLQLRGGTDSTTPIGEFIEILSEMGSVGVLIVWAFLEIEKISQVLRFSEEHDHEYPYRSHGQPLLAYAALIGCFFILIVVNGASLWNGFHKLPFLSSYLIVLTFLSLWILLKVVRRARWSFVDLSNPQKVVRKLRDLHDIRLGAT